MQTIKVMLRTILVIQFNDLCDGHSREGNPTPIMSHSLNKVPWEQAMARWADKISSTVLAMHANERQYNGVISTLAKAVSIFR
mgnify:CR=1 FL=1